MERETYRISMFGDIIDVYIEFFMNMNVVEKRLIGDTWFFTIESDGSSISFSIYERYWEKALSDIRCHRIDSVIS